MDFIKQSLATLSALLIAGGIALITVGTDIKDQPLSGITDSKCNVSIDRNVGVGHQVSTTILSASENRAWAKVSLVSTIDGVATSTPRLSFDEGASATLNSGTALSTTTQEYVFGRATEFPYVGAVTAITQNASTSVRVVECLY